MQVNGSAVPWNPIYRWLSAFIHFELQVLKFIGFLLLAVLCLLILWRLGKITLVVKIEKPILKETELIPAPNNVNANNAITEVSVVKTEPPKPKVLTAEELKQKVLRDLKRG